MDTTTNPTPTEQPVQQLSLLPTTQVPVQFRLDAETRRRGLRHIAEIRKVLADRQAAREAAAAQHSDTFRPRRAA